MSMTQDAPEVAQGATLRRSHTYPALFGNDGRYKEDPFTIRFYSRDGGDTWMIDGHPGADHPACFLHLLDAGILCDFEKHADLYFSEMNAKHEAAGFQTGHLEAYMAKHEITRNDMIAGAEKYLAWMGAAR